MHKTLTINIVLRIKVHKNGRDITPFIGPTLGRIGNGPLRKNMVMPYELEIALDIKVIKGNACSKLPKYGKVKAADVMG